MLTKLLIKSQGWLTTNWDSQNLSTINKLGLPNYHNQHSHHLYKYHLEYEKEEHYEALDGNLVVVKRICNSDTDDRRQLCLCDKGNSETLPQTYNPQCRDNGIK